MLSRTTANRFYTDQNPIGQMLKIGNESFMVTGIYDDIPDNTHFHFDLLLSMSSLEESFDQMWLSNNFHTYILLHPNTDPIKLEKQMQEMIATYMGPDLERLMGKTLDEFMGEGSAAYGLQKLTDIHLHSDLMAELESNSDISNVYVFSFIAFFILIIACINFMNMATARSESRSKEVGIRKVSGALRGQIIFQYLLESFVITLFAYFLAMILVEIYLPSFNNLSGKNININYFEPKTLLMLFGIIISTSLISGSYPSFYLSSFQPIETLKGTLKKGKSSGKLRNILVVIQFFTTILLISSSIFVYNQLNFIKTKKLGFEKEQLICVGNLNALSDKVDSFKQELLNYPEIISGTISSFLPVPSSSNNSVVFPDGDRNNIVNMYQWNVDVDYVKTFRMNIIEGRDFSSEFKTDSLAVLINEAALKQFGWKSAEGHFIQLYTDMQGSTANFKVVGVIQDFHYESLKASISPMLMNLSKGGFYLTLRYNATSTEEVIQLIEKKWKEFAPNYPFEYSFINERFNNIYFQEQRMGKIMKNFTFLAIIIASLGLFGLAAFIAEKRTKEIGIRKVNGASLLNIFMLFTKDIAKLIIIAFILAVPITWYIIDRWLNNFTYRVDINWMVFIGAGLISFLIAIITISYQAYHASTRNPIDSLKYE
ncbi:MAG: hypothetical protein CVU00_08695 [Bacteroidetes bacterium HGW-Bacteroidetes-17]|nr:MAG: hypothetical protein CVU00_08695 [Bacteroidetes bacterium HGW-Bacteroidetes-17]